MAFIYLFAIYGVCCFLYFNLRDRLPHWPLEAMKNLPENEVCFVVKVKDAEQTVEAFVWEYVKLSKLLEHPHRLMLLDTGSRDQTTAIIERLTYRYPYLTLEFASNQLGGRQIVVEYDPSAKPRQVVSELAKTFKQEFST